MQYVELCSPKQARQKKGDNRRISQQDIAEQLGINERTLRELLEIERKLTPEIKELLDRGIVSKTSASKIWTKLSSDEQSELLEELVLAYNFKLYPSDTHILLKLFYMI